MSFRNTLLTFSIIAASSAAAQDSAPEAVEAGVGLVIGLLIAIVVGAVVGWLASQIVKGSGSGFWGDVLIGIGGSLIATYLFPLVGINTGGSLLGGLLAALVGAVILILLVRLVRRAA